MKKQALKPSYFMIRKATLDDIDEIIDIWLSASIQSHDFVPASFWIEQADNMRHIYLPNSDVYVYQSAATITGFYALCDDTLAAIFVKPEHQGQGIGKALLNHAKAQRQTLTLTVYKANQASCQFYLSQGFNAEGEQIDSHTHQPEILMTYQP